MKKIFRLIDFIGAIAGFIITYLYFEGMWQTIGYIASVIGLIIAILNPAKYVEAHIKKKHTKQITSAQPESLPVSPSVHNTAHTETTTEPARPAKNGLADFSSYLNKSGSKHQFY